MSEFNGITIPKASDKSIIDFFMAVHQLLLGKYGAVSLSVHGEFGIDCRDINLSIPLSGLIDEIYSRNLTIIKTVHCYINSIGLEIVFYRGGHPNGKKPPYYDEIGVTYRSPASAQIDEIDKLNLVQKILTDLSGVKDGEPFGISSQALEAQNQFFALSKASIEQIQRVGLEFSGQIVKLEEELERRLFDKQTALEEKYLIRSKELEDEYLARFHDLERAQNELEAKKKEIDVREPRYVRRELRNELLREIKSRYEKFTLTEGTRHLRWPVHFALFLLFGLFVYGAYQYGTVSIETIVKSDVNAIFLMLLSVKPILLVAGAVATVSYYIRWQNKWFEQHAQAEFKLKQMQLDIERSSWLVETAFEWRSETNEPMDTSLLNSLSKNLFSYDEARDDGIRSPADEIASALMGSASNVKLKIGDNEIGLDRKSIKELEKSAKP